MFLHSTHQCHTYTDTMKRGNSVEKMAAQVLLGYGEHHRTGDTLLVWNTVAALASFGFGECCAAW